MNQKKNIRKPAHALLLTVCLLLLAACGGKRNVRTEMPEGGDTVRLAYARYLAIVKYEEFTQVTLRNPWDSTRILHTYLLVDKRKPAPRVLPQGTVVRVPLERMLVYSAVHCGLFEELGALEAVGGVCDLSYIRLEKIQKRVHDGRVADAGSSMSPDVERVIALHPDGILLSPFENGSYGRIEKLGIPLIECADYMEASALGRAEWMRFYGMLVGKEREADSLFAEVEHEYQALRDGAHQVEEKPVVLAELKQGSAWYVPGGQSVTGQMYADAGARYAFGSIAENGSVPLSFETVFDRARHADYWLVKYNQAHDKTYAELEQDYRPYTGFDAFRKRKIYGCNTAKVSYYEEIPFHPERLLKDLIAVFHPDMFPDYKARYFTPLAGRDESE